MALVLERRSIETGLPSVGISLTAGACQLRQCAQALGELLDRVVGEPQRRRRVMADIPGPERLIAAAISDPSEYYYHDGPPEEARSRAVLAALTAAGYTVVPAADLEHARELAAEQSRNFPRCLLIKPAREQDLYVGWSVDILGLVAMWTREEAIAAGCPPSKLNRADETGTSARDGYGHWDTDGVLVGRRGFLPRARLADYAAACTEGRLSDALGLLEPYDAKTPPSRH
jgi:hypothetical protein